MLSHCIFYLTSDIAIIKRHHAADVSAQEDTLPICKNEKLSNFPKLIDSLQLSQFVCVCVGVFL